MYTEHSATIFGMMALAGFGTALRFMSTPLHGVGMFRRHRATVIGLLGVAFPLGGTLGVTIMSTVLNNTSKFIMNGGDFSTIRSMPPQMLAEYKKSAKMGIIWSIVAITPFLLLAWLCACCLGNIKLGQGYGPDEDGAQNEIVEGVYLLTLIRKSDGAQKDKVEEGIMLDNSVTGGERLGNKKDQRPQSGSPDAHRVDSTDRCLP